MSTIRSILLALTATAALAAASATQARDAPMVTFENIAIAPADGRALTLDKVKAAIVRAASSREWAASVKDARTVRATYTRRGHSAIVDVAYSQSSYSIRYVDSTGLSYSDKDGKAVIHPTYNKVVTALRQHIDSQLRAASR